MTRQQYIINRKLNIVELAEKLGNITKACGNPGVSRQHYYDIKAALVNVSVKLIHWRSLVQKIFCLACGLHKIRC